MAIIEVKVVHAGSERLALPLAERKNYNRIIVLLHDHFDNLVNVAAPLLAPAIAAAPATPASRFASSPPAVAGGGGGGSFERRQRLRR